MNPARIAALFLLSLAGCGTTAPSTDSTVTEDWKREALEQRKTFTKDGPDAMFGYAGRVNALLDKPDPPAISGPTLRSVPSTDTTGWPAARDGVLTVRYRIERKSCGGYGASEGCHLA